MSSNELNISSLKEFAARLRSERERLWPSQKKAGERCGVSGRSWADYEEGKIAPKADVLLRLQAAGADVLYILTGERAQPPLVVNGERAAYNAGLSPEEAALLDNYRHAGEAGRKAIREVGAALAQCAGDERREG